jgi:hypothetical protein
MFTRLVIEGTYAFVFFGDLDKTQLEYSFKKPCSPVYVAIVGGERYLIDTHIGRKVVFLPLFEFE